jgi:hypothetical protein
MIYLRFALAILGAFFLAFIIVTQYTNYGSLVFDQSASIIGEASLIISIIVIYIATALLACTTAYRLNRAGPNWGLFSIICPFLAPLVLAFLPKFSEDKKAMPKIITKYLSNLEDRLSSLADNDQAVWIIIGFIAIIILGVLGFLIYGLVKVLIHRPDLRYIFLFLFTIASITTLSLKHLKKSQNTGNTQTMCAKCGNAIANLKAGLYTGEDLYSALEGSIFYCEICNSNFCSDCMISLKHKKCPNCSNIISDQIDENTMAEKIPSKINHKRNANR